MLNRLKLIAQIILLFIVFPVLFLIGFMSFAPVFGGKPDADSYMRIVKSINFNGEHFDNLVPTSVSTKNADSPSFIEATNLFFFQGESKNPAQSLPSKISGTLDLQDGQITWLGHSTVAFKTSGLTIVTDPVFHRASPVPIGGKPFAYEPEINSAALPDTNVVLISHDHYDHLDVKTVKEIDERVGHYLVPLGVKAHLQRWGVSSSKIHEMDWYDSKFIDGVEFVLTPSRHFSGRGLTDRFATLWGSWVVRSADVSVFFSGDSGYSSEFKRIGELFGPFDIALMENGAYNTDWAQIHMFPEQTLQAAKELKAKAVLPIHWGKYDLAYHHWLEPVERIEKAATTAAMPLVTPIVGEVFEFDNLSKSRWWQNL